MSSADAEAANITNYLKQHGLTEKLSAAVNAVAKTQPSDAIGALITQLQKFAAAPTITRLVGREVLDSRGNPTVEADVYATVNGTEKLVGRQAAPSGASTGSNEAHELRDKDPKRYLGKGTQIAAGHVTKELTEAVRGLPVTALHEIDDALCKKDGTQLKKVLGGNALTAVSFAVAEAGASLAGVQLFEHFARLFHGADKVPAKFSLPRPMVNILNGGKHAGGNLKLQEFMIVPAAGRSFRENLRTITEVYHHLAKILVAKYGVSAKNLGDEGGYAPALDDPDEALKLIETAIVDAQYKVGEDVFLAVDAAASEFYVEGKYEVRPKKFLTTDEMIDFWVKIKKDHPALISIEDGLHEQDYDGWVKLTARFKEEFKDGVILVGDDLYTTNTELIKKGIEHKWATALLLKVNQIGTISEAMAAARMIFDDHGAVAVSHRSGETVGSVISDLAVGIGAQFIKTGATARGERIAKYNRLLQIEDYLKEHDKLKI